MVSVASLVFNAFTNDSRVLKEGLSLHRSGYDVTVVAHLDKGLKQEEMQDGLLVKRLGYLDRSITRHKLGKLKAFFHFCRESIQYCKKFDILHCNDINTLPIGVIIKKFYNKQVKIVYDAHEYETETYALKGMQRIIVKIIERFLIRYADSVITVSESISTEYSRIYNIKKPDLVLNAPAFTEIVKDNKFREVFDIKDDMKIFIYQGGLGYNRGIELLLEVFSSGSVDGVIVFMGYGDMKAYIETMSKKNSYIFFHNAVSPTELLGYTASADFGIATIEDSCLSYRYCLPNKLFEYIMAEVPVIVSDLPEMSKIVKQFKVGTVMHGNGIDGIKKAIEEAILLNPMELRSNLRLAKKIYNWEEQEKILLNVYRNLK